MRAWLACHVPMNAPKSVRPGCEGSPSAHATNAASGAALGGALCEMSGIVRQAAKSRNDSAKSLARDRMARAPNRRRLAPAKRVPAGVVARHRLTPLLQDELPPLGESVADFVTRKSTGTEPGRLFAADETEQ